MLKENTTIPMVIAEPLHVVERIEDCDCSDCACSTSELPDIINFNRQATKYVKSPTSYQTQLSEDFAVWYGPYHQPVVLNQPAQKLVEYFEQSRTLQSVNNCDNDAVADALRKLCDVGLLQPLEYVPVLQQRKENVTAWLHVTDRCNLRCTYCYLPHVHQDMSLATGKQVINKIVESALSQGYQIVKLKYAGGEALLRFPFIKELHKYAQGIADANSLRLEGVILSNGTLLNQVIARSMSELKLNLMISLDGLGRVHDAHRPYAGRRGSFEDVQAGIRIAKQLGLNLTISVTISDETAIGLPSLVHWLLAENLYFTLNFYRTHDQSDDKLSFKDETIIQGILSAYKEIEKNLPSYSLLNAIVDRANLSAPHLHTCGVGNNYMVFDPQGHVAKCQMHLYVGPRNQDTSQPLHWVQTSTDGIQNLSVNEKEGCSSCQWKYWCAGGCPLLTYQTTGRYNVKSPNCRIYKTIYPEAMRLEGLRLAKIHGTDLTLET
jgi:uncharacterized protein